MLDRAELAARSLVSETGDLATDLNQVPEKPHGVLLWTIGWEGGPA
jgi:hypothetical protein